MRRNRMLGWTLAALLAGCGGHAKFADEGEELAYLSALSNPSPGQWKRREELRGKAAEVEAQAKRTRDRAAYEAKSAADAHRARAEREDAEREAAREREDAERERKAEAADVARLLAQARAYESQGEFGLAFRSYRELVEKHPGAPEAGMARERASADHERAYGSKIDLP